MYDTHSKIAAMVAERHRQMTPDDRVRIASDMFETARLIVASSLPENLNPYEHRLALIRRLYGNELPEKAMIAFAKNRGEACGLPASSDGERNVPAHGVSEAPGR